MAEAGAEDLEAGAAGAQEAEEAEEALVLLAGSTQNSARRVIPGTQVREMIY